MKHVSYSQYFLWANCPLHWKLNYIDKLSPYESSIHTVFGTAMHNTVQHWLGIVFNKSKLVARTMDLNDLLKDFLIKEFKKSTVEENGQKIFVCDKPTLMEFYDDGCQILRYLQDNVDKHFATVEWTLEGIEIPLSIKVKDNNGTTGAALSFRGYLDVVLRHKLTGTIRIIDLKTSTKGWNKWQKADKAKTNQLLIYKHYYAKKFDVDEDLIVVEFIILKRKLWEGSPYPIPRCSPFIPAHKAVSVKKAMKAFEEFVEAAHIWYGGAGGHPLPTPSKSACRFCPYLKTEHCGEGIEP